MQAATRASSTLFLQTLQQPRCSTPARAGCSARLGGGGRAPRASGCAVGWGVGRATCMCKSLTVARPSTLRRLSPSLRAQLARLPTIYNADLGLYILNSNRWALPEQEIRQARGGGGGGLGALCSASGGGVGWFRATTAAAAAAAAPQRHPPHAVALQAMGVLQQLGHGRQLGALAGLRGGARAPLSPLRAPCACPHPPTRAGHPRAAAPCGPPRHSPCPPPDPPPPGQAWC